jgi:hypothetical protein
VRVAIDFEGWIPDLVGHKKMDSCRLHNKNYIERKLTTRRLLFAARAVEIPDLPVL